jgi:DNA invertase Pin-like site-specific DNA recombinase
MARRRPWRRPTTPNLTLRDGHSKKYVHQSCTVKGRLLFTALVEQLQKSLRAVGYGRVSSQEQADSKAGLAAQRTVVVTEVERRGWDLVEYVEDPAQSSTTLQRPGMQRALELLDRRQADVLVVSRLDRMTRSLRDFGELTERARRRGWALVCIDVAVDMTTPAGELVAGMIASAAQYERRLIGQRTREALAEKRAAGVRLGRPQRLPQATVDQIVRLRATGASLRAIGAALETDQVPTASGGIKWHASTIREVLGSQAARGSS